MASQFQFEAIGTHWQIDIADALSTEQESALLKQIHDRIDVFDKDYSRFREDSLVTEMSKHAGEYTLPVDAQPMMDLYAALYEITQGRLTPLIGQVLVDAGYDPQYSLVQKKPLEQPLPWNEVMEYAYPRLTIRKPVLLDVGALGKGYLIDIVGEIIEAAGIHNYCVDAGGDIRYRTSSDKPLRIGLENPENFSQVIGTVSIQNRSLCGSAGSRRKWQDFHHIIDPYKLASPKEILATWAIADTTLLADGLASCLFFIKSDELISRYSFEYLVLYADFSIEKSAGFPGEVFGI